MDFAALAGTLAGSLAFFWLVLTPGAWITFGLPLPGVKFWARLFTAAALSPLIVSAQFFVVRAAGLPFRPAAFALLLLNLPAAYLIFRNRPAGIRLPGSAWLVGALVAGLCVALMLPPLLSLGFRLYSPHAWVYSDPVYLFARGNLVLEDPTLAGVRLAYPAWPALVFQALASYLLNAAPASNWVWGNLVSLILVCGFAVGMTREMGGGRLAQGSTAVFLTLGTNPIGYILMTAWPAMAGLRLFGDLRYTPWIQKFYLFSTMPLGLALIAALLYLLVLDIPIKAPLWTTLCLLVSGVGLLYPLVLPPAYGILGAKILVLLWQNRHKNPRFAVESILPWIAILLVSALATVAELKFLVQSRHAGSPVLLSALSAALRKGVVAVIVTLPLLVGFVMVLRQTWKTRPSQTLLLAAGAAASGLLHSVFSIPYWDNEYKFIFTVGMCLAPFPALAVERAWHTWPRPAAAFALAMIAVLLVRPRHPPLRPNGQPRSRPGAGGRILS